MGMEALTKVPGVPGVAVETATEMGKREIEMLRKNNILGKNEELIYFYSEDILSILTAGNILTDNRIVAYETIDGELDMYSAMYREIVDVYIVEEGGFFSDSIAWVDVGDDDGFYIYLSSDENGDEKFVEAANTRIAKRNRGRQQESTEEQQE
jgi:hypothetical protein